ncbi:MAG: aminoacyl-tRNA hydrolase [Phycisphaeraceae bacterium]
MRLIVGLGNPGQEYAKTRHNAGFMVLERLAQRYGLSGAKMRFRSGVLEGPIAGERCLLMQPTTYMNRSGQAVGEAVRFYKLEPGQDLLVVVDDAALPVGRIRLRGEGSAGGHNGLSDIERHLSTRAYPRLRVGIDPPPPRVKQRDWVLGKFTPEQMDELEIALERACDAIESWIRDGLDKTMSLYNAAE